jgi:hypothetical protein
MVVVILYSANQSSLRSLHHAVWCSSNVRNIHSGGFLGFSSVPTNKCCNTTPVLLIIYDDYNEYVVVEVVFGKMNT